MHILLGSIKSGFDFARGKQVSDIRARAKYVIFLAAFVFEDIGQVLIQETYQFTRLFSRKVNFFEISCFDTFVVPILRTVRYKCTPLLVGECLLDDFHKCNTDSDYGLQVPFKRAEERWQKTNFYSPIWLPNFPTLHTSIL